MWAALDGLSRYIATPTVAKHRLFVWCDSRICPDHQLIVIARDDDTTFGICTAGSTRSGRSGSGRVWKTGPATRRQPPSRRSRSRPAWRRTCPRPSTPPTRVRLPLRTPPGLVEAARPLAQPARVGRVGRRAGFRLSKAARSSRRGGGAGAQETHADEPLQRPPAMARRRTRSP